MLIERVELRLLSLPMVEPLAAAHGTSAQRDLVVVRVDTDIGPGWGECAALAEPTYSDEFAAGAFGLLDEELAPRLVGHDLQAGTVLGRLSMVPGNPMAKAAVEMALLDIELRASGRSLAAWLGATVDRVPAGVAVGLGPPQAVADRVAALEAEGYGRVKLKIQPGHERAVVEAVRSRCPDIEIHLDANGSFGPDHLDLLAGLAADGSAGIRTLEQPFPARQPDLAAALVARLAAVSGTGAEATGAGTGVAGAGATGAGTGVAVVADEAATSLGAVRRLRQAGAVTGVSVKPSRLGGLQAARRLHDTCFGWGLALSAGGMVECGLGRHALAALAALPGFNLTGDVSPARRWLAADPWPDLTLKGGHIVVPTGHGVAPAPDPDVLNRHTVKRAELRA